ncbi:MAG: MFS transporter, partial [Thermofilaceae archaeon]
LQIFARSALKSPACRASIVHAYVVSYAASLLQALFLPVLSLYASYLGLSEAEVGVLAGVSLFLYVPSALLSEFIVRKHGYRRPTSASLALIALSYAMLSAARTPVQLAFAAGMVSLAYGIFWPSVEKAVSAQRGSVHAFSVSWSAGSLTGALSIAPLLNLGFQALYAICAATALALTPLPLRFKGRSEEKSAARASLRGMWKSWLLCVGYSTSAGGLLTFYPLVSERLGLPSYSVSLATFSMMAGRTAAFYASGRLKLPALLSLPLLLAVAASPWSSSIPLHALLAAAAGVGQSLIYTLALEGVFNAGGAYTSVFEATIGLGYALGPLIGAAARLLGFEALAASAAAAAALSLPPLVFRARRGAIEGGANPS